MEQLFISLYTNNENYHDKKEQMVWLTSTVYLSFSLAILAWLSSNKCSWNSQRLLFACFVLLVLAITLAFATIQNWYKCRSVLVTARLNRLIARMDHEPKPTYKDLKDALEYPKRIRLYQKAKYFLTIGLSGFVIEICLCLFGAAQLALIFLL